MVADNLHVGALAIEWRLGKHTIQYRRFYEELKAIEAAEREGYARGYASRYQAVFLTQFLVCVYSRNITRDRIRIHRIHRIHVVSCRRLTILTGSPKQHMS